MFGGRGLAREPYTFKRVQHHCLAPQIACWIRGWTAKCVRIDACMVTVAFTSDPSSYSYSLNPSFLLATNYIFSDHGQMLQPSTPNPDDQLQAQISKPKSQTASPKPKTLNPQAPFPNGRSRSRSSDSSYCMRFDS